VQQLEQLLLVNSKQRDAFLDHCIQEHSIENVNFLIAFEETQRYWRVHSDEAIGLRI
jgi:hypothetical protein